MEVLALSTVSVEEEVVAALSAGVTFIVIHDVLAACTAHYDILSVHIANRMSLVTLSVLQGVILFGFFHKCVQFIHVRLVLLQNLEDSFLEAMVYFRLTSSCLLR